MAVRSLSDGGLRVFGRAGSAIVRSTTPEPLARKISRIQTDGPPRSLARRLATGARHLAGSAWSTTFIKVSAREKPTRSPPVPSAGTPWVAMLPDPPQQPPRSPTGAAGVRGRWGAGHGAIPRPGTPPRRALGCGRAPKLQAACHTSGGFTHNHNSEAQSTKCKLSRLRFTEVLCPVCRRSL